MKVCSEDEKDPQAIESLQESRVIPGVGKSFSPRDYEGAVTRALERVRRTPTPTTTEREEARWRAAELLACTPEELDERLVPGSIYACWDVFHVLEAELLPATLHRPSAGQAMARMALRVASRLERTPRTGALVEDAKAVALVHLANAYRVGSDLEKAEKVLALARYIIDLGTGDPLVEIFLLEVLHSIRASQNQVRDAERVSARALGLARATKDIHLEGRIELQLAAFLHYLGRHKGAIEISRSALAKVDPGREPRLMLVARHNLMLAQLGLGDVEAAEAEMSELRSLHARFPDVNARARLLWLEARLAAAREHYDEAEALYQKARSAFLEHGIEGDAALVTRELAELYLKSA